MNKKLIPLFLALISPVGAAAQEGNDHTDVYYTPEAAFRVVEPSFTEPAPELKTDCRCCECPTVAGELPEPPVIIRSVMPILITCDDFARQDGQAPCMDPAPALCALDCQRDGEVHYVDKQDAP